MNGADNYRVIGWVEDRCVGRLGLIFYLGGKMPRQPREIELVAPFSLLEIGQYCPEIGQLLEPVERSGQDGVIPG